MLTRRSRRSFRVLVGVAVAAIAVSGLGACSSSTESLPGGAQPSNQINLATVEPTDGVQPVVDFINSATNSIDMYMYEFDPTYKPIVSALQNVQKRGVVVRLLLSRQLFGEPVNNHNVADQKTLIKLGIPTQLSRPEFHDSHAKDISLDAGTSSQRVMVCDFNVGAGYFGVDPKPIFPGEGGTRGMSVIDTNEQDVNRINETFNADWPPYGPWPAATQPNLVWGPSAAQYQPPGNAVAALTSLINGAQNTLDIYVQALALPSQLYQPVLNRAKAGVKVRIVGNKGGINSQALPTLKAAGVQVVYGPKAIVDPSKFLYIHTKTIVVDAATSQAVAFVGSENPFLDESINDERELGAFVTTVNSVNAIEAVFNRDFSVSTPY